MKPYLNDSPLIWDGDAAHVLDMTREELEQARRRHEVVGEPQRERWWQWFPTWKYRLDVLRDFHQRRFGQSDAYPVREESGDLVLSNEWIRSIVRQALDRNASDIHFEPVKHASIRVRFRIDGTLYPIATWQHVDASGMKPISSWENKVTAIPRCLLMMADGLNPFLERQAPQEGTIRFVREEREIWARLSTISSRHGITAVLHLTPSAASESLAALGFNTSLQSQAMASLLDLSRAGVTLFAAPRGEGLTTTLRTCLLQVNRPERNIYFFDDVADFPVAGVTRVVYDRENGLTPAVAVKMARQQGADLLIFGDISDRETALAMIEAAEMGKTVWAAVRMSYFAMDEPAKVAAQVLYTRLQRWGIASERLQKVFNGALLQRLVRRLCPDCREAISPEKKEWLQLWLSQYLVGNGETIYQANGCSLCDNTGYRGRTGLFLAYNPAYDPAAFSAENDVSFTQAAMPLLTAGITDTNELKRLQVL